MGCRDTKRGQAVVNDLAESGLPVHLLEIDVASDASVKAAAKMLAQQTATLMCWSTMPAFLDFEQLR